MIDTCFPVDLELLKRALISGPVVVLATITPNWCARRVAANAARGGLGRALSISVAWSFQPASERTNRWKILVI
jgi:hypothetical protein